MSTDAGHPVNAQPKRPWFQFSLRTLLVLMLALGCGLGWLGNQVDEARKRQVAAEVFRDPKLGSGEDWALFQIQ